MTNSEWSDAAVNADRHGCPHCHNTGWACEAHPDRPMGHDADCAGPGMLCRCAAGQALERQLDRMRTQKAERGL